MQTPESNVSPLFEIGAVVQLRSGGPLLCMTYSQFTSAHVVNVVYYNTVTGLFETFATHENCLKHANTLPFSPESAHDLRNTTVAKSSIL